MSEDLAPQTVDRQTPRPRRAASGDSQNAAPGREPEGPESSEEVIGRLSLQRAAEDAASVYRATTSSARPLDKSVRSDMESSLGADFGDVRIHTGRAASESARALGAAAYTAGRDIVFGDGGYAPETPKGRHVLAHELAHVVQQRSGSVEGTEVSGGVRLSHPSDRFEQAAEETASKVTAAGPDAALPAPQRRVTPSLRTVHALQRTVGNAAVAAWVTSELPSGGREMNDADTTGAGAPVMTVQRFEGPEHKELGDVTGADVDLGNGVVLTWGQVVAIAGDEFGSVEELRAAAATEEGRRRIHAALEHDRVLGPKPTSLPAITQADRDAQSKAFLELAAANVSHFAAGGDALATWRSHHQRALARALEAGMTGDEAAFQDAQLIEAFGQHFLTDMFSGGHVRTPRMEIMQYYEGRSTEMATAFMNNLRARVEDGLVSQVMLQLDPRLRGGLMQNQVRQRVHAAVGTRLDEELAKIGGMPGFAKYFGLAIAGAVSGAVHDREGRTGVVVTSVDHPQPWLAKGDAMLSQSPESRDQAERAVLAGREELLAARYAGSREQKLEKLAPADPPGVVYFGFNSSALNGAASTVAAAGAFLHVNPSHRVEAVGHTDPLGPDGYNQGLGQQRAESVRAALIAGGASPFQITTSSQGEAALVSSDPRQFRLNRRVELLWQCGPPPSGAIVQDDARARAQREVATFGPPFDRVERYVPRALDHMNEPLPEWRWGQMAPELVTELDTWVREKVGPQTSKLVDAVPETLQEGNFTLAPRQLVAGIVAQLMAAPARTLGDLIGQPPGK
jgi:outer membrane protein OmpA-like peptidoglycan-associated protein